ncbi:DBF4-type zinc finger-containing protein 2 homolog, partial [Gorilla gorilla gorilla]|uniref:DBF4-type zinc finger-containing protein 2 homolog n=1 Tax=Gorilla gorilla gorilla TaxID=9595 RepID=UPI00300B23EC
MCSFHYLEDSTCSPRTSSPTGFLERRLHGTAPTLPAACESSHRPPRGQECVLRCLQSLAPPHDSASARRVLPSAAAGAFATSPSLLLAGRPGCPGPEAQDPSHAHAPHVRHQPLPQLSLALPSPPSARSPPLAPPCPPRSFSAPPPAAPPTLLRRPPPPVPPSCSSHLVLSSALAEVAAGLGEETPTSARRGGAGGRRRRVESLGCSVSRGRVALPGGLCPSRARFPRPPVVACPRLRSVPGREGHGGG